MHRVYNFPCKIKIANSWTYFLQASVSGKVKFTSRVKAMYAQMGVTIVAVWGPMALRQRRPPFGHVVLVAFVICMIEIDEGDKNEAV